MGRVSVPRAPAVAAGRVRYPTGVVSHVFIMRVVLFGPPGSGKGTQARLLQKHFGLFPISTGELIREEVKLGTHAGLEAVPYLNDGKLVPGKLVREMAENAISERNYDEFILDGYPRTVEQAVWLDEFLGALNLRLDAIISIKVPLEVLVERLSKRRVNALTGENYHLDFKPPPENLDPSLVIQRSDDQPDAIRKRLAVYRRDTEPVETFYQERPNYYTVDGVGDQMDVHERIASVLRRVMQATRGAGSRPEKAAESPSST